MYATYGDLKNEQIGSNSKNINDIQSLEERKKFIGKRGDNKVCLIKYYADWCGPCKRASEIFNIIANNFITSKNIVFCQENVDLGIETEGYELYAVPTIVLFFNGDFIRTFEGVNGDNIDNINRFLSDHNIKLF